MPVGSKAIKRTCCCRNKAAAAAAAKSEMQAKVQRAEQILEAQQKRWVETMQILLSIGFTMGFYFFLVLPSFMPTCMYRLTHCVTYSFGFGCCQTASPFLLSLSGFETMLVLTS